MTRDEFIEKWVDNPEQQYTEEIKDEIILDLDNLINQSYNNGLKYGYLIGVGLLLLLVIFISVWVN